MPQYNKFNLMEILVTHNKTVIYITGFEDYKLALSDLCIFQCGPSFEDLENTRDIHLSLCSVAVLKAEEQRYHLYIRICIITDISCYYPLVYVGGTAVVL
jgi:hypothetical protein